MNFGEIGSYLWNTEYCISRLFLWFNKSNPTSSLSLHLEGISKDFGKKNLGELSALLEHTSNSHLYKRIAGFSSSAKTKWRWQGSKYPAVAPAPFSIFNHLGISKEYFQDLFSPSLLKRLQKAAGEVSSILTLLSLLLLPPQFLPLPLGWSPAQLLELH